MNENISGGRATWAKGSSWFCELISIPCDENPKMLIASSYAILGEWPPPWMLRLSMVSVGGDPQLDMEQLEADEA